MPNTALCPVCAGLPGALPVLNRRAVELATRPRSRSVAGSTATRSSPERTTSTRTSPRATRSRSSTGRSRPAANVAFSSNGQTFASPSPRIHMEEDAGKSLHVLTAAAGLLAVDAPGFQPQRRAADRNRHRAGPPSAADAAEAFSRVRELLVALRRQRRQHGGRQPALRRQRLDPAGRRSGVRREDRAEEPQLVPARAARARFEIERHIKAARRRHAPSSRRRDCSIPATGRTTVHAHEGRGGRLPLLPGAGPAAAGPRRRRRSKTSARSLPELPAARRARFVADYKLPEYDAGVLTQTMALADYFERVAAASGNPKAASNWIMGELSREAEGDARRDRARPAGRRRARRTHHDGRERQHHRAPSPRKCSKDVRQRPTRRRHRPRRRARQD